MDRKSGLGLLIVCVAAALVLAGCGGGGGGHTYVMKPTSPLGAGVYLTLVSPVPLPQGLLDRMKKGLTLVEHAQGPEACKYSKEMRGAAGRYRYLNGNTMTVKVNGSSRFISLVCSGLQKEAAFNLASVSGSATTPTKTARDNSSNDGETIRIATGTATVGNSASPSALQGAADVAKLLNGIPQHGLVLGSPNAPVTLIEYIDLQCPVCDEFEATELAPLVHNYVRRGKLKIEMQPWSILDQNPGEYDSDRGQKATIGAAAQNKAFNFAEVLYDNQGTEGTGWMNDAMISNIAASVDGLKPYQLATDANGAATQSVIKAITDWANAHPQEMTGTPTLYLKKGVRNPQYFGTGVPDLGSLEAAINARLK